MEELVKFWGCRLEFGDDVIIRYHQGKQWDRKRDGDLERIVNLRINKRKNELQEKGEVQQYFLCLPEHFIKDSRVLFYKNNHSLDVVNAYFNSILSDAESEYKFDMYLEIDQIGLLAIEFEDKLNEAQEENSIGFTELAINKFRREAYINIKVQIDDMHSKRDLVIDIPCRCISIGKGEMPISDLMDYCGNNTIL